MVRDFKISKKKNKVGEVSVIRFNKTGHRTLEVSGKEKIDSSSFSAIHNHFQKILHSISLSFLRLFPDILNQDPNTSIPTFSIAESYSIRKTSWLYYSLTYTMNGGSNTKTAIDIVLDKNQIIRDKITSCMLSDPLEQVCVPSVLPEKRQLSQHSKDSPLSPHRCRNQH